VAVRGTTIHGRPGGAGRILALWSDTEPDQLAAWAAWADDVRGRAIAAGHFLPEEAPGEVVKEFVAFFGECT
jgi:haloacetate dehalogenase